MIAAIVHFIIMVRAPLYFRKKAKARAGAIIHLRARQRYAIRDEETVPNRTVGGVVQFSRERAEQLVSSTGWLAAVPDPIRRLVLEHAVLQSFNPGMTVFRQGDPPGGIYGLVAGTVCVDTAVPEATPQLIHLALPGAWTGEGCFMTGQPRRVELRTVSEAWVMHVPLKAMESIAAQEPRVIRAFGVISILAADLLVRIVHDLQKRNAGCRVASVLHRLAWANDVPISISQDDLGAMANASRTQVNAAIQHFAAEGWETTAYRAISVINPVALYQYADQGNAI